MKIIDQDRIAERFQGDGAISVVRDYLGYTCRYRTTWREILQEIDRQRDSNFSGIDIVAFRGVEINALDIVSDYIERLNKKEKDTSESGLASCLEIKTPEGTTIGE